MMEYGQRDKKQFSTERIPCPVQKHFIKLFKSKQIFNENSVKFRTLLIPLHWQSYPSNMPNSDPQEGFAVPDEDDGMPPPPDEGY